MLLHQDRLGTNTKHKGSFSSKQLAAHTGTSRAEFRTRFPRAPAAFARVFSSSSAERTAAAAARTGNETHTRDASDKTHRTHAPGKSTVVSIANGWLRYLPHAEHFTGPRANEQYEVLQSTFEAGAAEELIRQALALQQALESEPKPR